ADQGDAELRVHQRAVLPAQLDRPGVEDRGAAKGDGDAVDHRALGRAFVDYNALDLPGRSRQRVVGALVQGPDPEGAIHDPANVVSLQDVGLGAVREHLGLLSELFGGASPCKPRIFWAFPSDEPTVQDFFAACYSYAPAHA